MGYQDYVTVYFSSIIFIHWGFFLSGFFSQAIFFSWILPDFVNEFGK